jgi:LEA14-like dessication related protein
MPDQAHRTLATVALLLLLTAGCLGVSNPLTRVDPPSLVLLDLRPIRGGDLEQRLDLDLLVQNPNNFDVVLAGMRLQLEMNGDRVAQAVSSESVSIGRLGETRVTIQASITLVDVVRVLLTSRDPEEKSLKYRISGDAFVTAPRSTRVSFEGSGQVLPGVSATAK